MSSTSKSRVGLEGCSWGPLFVESKPMSGEYGTISLVSHLSLCLVIVITLVLLTSCGVMGLSMGLVNCDVMSGQPYYLASPPIFA